MQQESWNTQQQKGRICAIGSLNNWQQKDRSNERWEFVLKTVPEKDRSTVVKRKWWCPTIETERVIIPDNRKADLLCNRKADFLCNRKADLLNRKANNLFTVRQLNRKTDLLCNNRNADLLSTTERPIYCQQQKGRFTEHKGRFTVNNTKADLLNRKVDLLSTTERPIY